MAKKNNPAVSVIIAMYNAENFIDETLNSLLSQTFQDFEIIVVDDCSTDNSCAVVGNFSAKFGDRLKVAKLSMNSGTPGIPRNFALEAARGKYVYFLDADDLLVSSALEELYYVAEEFKADVVHAEKTFAFFDEDGVSGAEPISFQTGELVTEPTLETLDIGERVTDFIRKRYLWWACNKLFRRQFLLDNKIKFSAIKTFEDFVFAFMSLVAAKNYVRVPFVNYYYRVRKNSLSHESRDAVELSTIMIKVVGEPDNFMNGRKFFRENYQARYALLDFLFGSGLKSLRKIFSWQASLTLPKFSSSLGRKFSLQKQMTTPR